MEWGKSVDVWIPSNYFNVIHFIIVDVAITAIFIYITSDIAGRLSSRAAAHGQSESVIVRDPPLIGGGVTGTRKRDFLFISAVRFIFIIIAAALSFLSEGKAERLIVRRDASVLTAGPLKTTDMVDIDNQIALRRSCLGFVEGYMFFGELRTMGNESSCEKDYSLVTNAIMFRLELERVYFDLRTDGCHLDWPSFTLRLSCKHALIKCLGKRTHPFPKSCGGVLNVNRSMFLCNGESLFIPALSNIKSGKVPPLFCKRMVGGNANTSFWFDPFGTLIPSLQATFYAVSVSGRETKEVKVVEQVQDITQLEFMYILLLTFILLLMVLMIAVSLCLRSKGYTAFANSETSIAALIKLVSTTNTSHSDVLTNTDSLSKISKGRSVLNQNILELRFENDELNIS